MVMAQMTPGSAPIVGEHKGDVAVWAGPEDDPIGFVLPCDAAVTVAGRLLRAVALLKGDDLPMLAIDSVTAEPAILDDGEEAVKLTFVTDGAPLAIWLDLTRFAELTAGFAVISRGIDSGEAFKPRR